MRKKTFLAYVYMTLGAVIAALGVKIFLVPNNIAPAGFSGIGAIFWHTLGIPIGVVILALNIPLFFVAFKEHGKTFLIRTIYATVIYSVANDAINFGALTNDYLMSSIFGGVVFGAGIGLVLRGGGTTGGTELLAKIILKKVKGISIGLMVFIIDIIIVASSAFVFGIESSLYAVITLFLGSKIIDIVSNGANVCKAYMIISDKPDEINLAIEKRLKRGTTFFYGKGGYTGGEKRVLLCVVGSSIESVILKGIIEKTDEKAFVLALSASEVLGYGFGDKKEE